jgi:hypothetical protein
VRKSARQRTLAAYFSVMGKTSMARSVQAKVVARLFAVPLEKPAHNCIDEATLKRLIVGYTTQAMYQVSTEVRQPI